MLRVKMAANDMPDLFDTHGWAKIRYGEYTADLKDMDWVKHLDPNLDPILKDEKAKYMPTLSIRQKTGSSTMPVS